MVKQLLPDLVDNYTGGFRKCKAFFKYFERKFEVMRVYRSAREGNRLEGGCQAWEGRGGGGGILYMLQGRDVEVFVIIPLGRWGEWGGLSYLVVGCGLLGGW